LFVANVTQTPPSTIMSYIIVQSLLKSSFGFGKIFIIDMFMAAERMGIGILRI
jgi:hypothetical protein